LESESSHCAAAAETNCAVATAAAARRVIPSFANSAATLTVPGARFSARAISLLADLQPVKAKPHADGGYASSPAGESALAAAGTLPVAKLTEPGQTSESPLAVPC